MGIFEKFGKWNRIWTLGVFLILLICGWSLISWLQEGSARESSDPTGSSDSQTGSSAVTRSEESATTSGRRIRSEKQRNQLSSDEAINKVFERVRKDEENRAKLIESTSFEDNGGGMQFSFSIIRPSPEELESWRSLKVEFEKRIPLKDREQFNSKFDNIFRIFSEFQEQFKYVNLTIPRDADQSVTSVEAFMAAEPEMDGENFVFSGGSLTSTRDNQTKWRYAHLFEEAPKD